MLSRCNVLRKPIAFVSALASAGAALLIVSSSEALGATFVPAKEDPIVLMQTTKGPIKVQIYKVEAPITSNNFLDLVNRHFYDGLTFHRYEPGFVIQGGDPTGTGGGNFTDPKTKKDRCIALEKKDFLRHDAAGVIAMARTNDPNSASCQFYFTLAAADFLDNPPGYAVFGKVVDGLPNVMKLRKGDKMTKVSVEK